jgi:predicted SAM-dependent methyltransferase
VRTPLPVAASIAQRPGYAGHAWAFLHYALGLRELGYEPVLIDRLSAEMTTGADGRPCETTRRAAIAWFEQVVELAGLAGSSSLLLDAGETIGLDRAELTDRIKASPCLLDVMGFLSDPSLLAASEMTVFIDVDPGFTQLWHEFGQASLFTAHDRHVTVGANIGRPGCEIPDCGLRWIAIRPPVALERWPVASGSGGAFRSVGSWRGPYDPIEYGGRRLGLRAHELRRFMSLPSLLDADFELALDIDPADRRDARALAQNGWRLHDPRVAAGTLAGYQSFVRGSGAEIAVAKNIYVATNSGWFSDRSACFLASGRPVLCQDTGLGDLGSAARGVLRFATLQEAVDGANEILGDWRRHSRAARDIAEDVFDAKKVLAGLLDSLGVGWSRPGARTGRAKPRRAVDRDGGRQAIARLNWGCGSHLADGWINSDIKDAPGVDLAADVRHGLPLASESIDYAVSIHALPEFSYPELPGVLAELRRVLKPGGVLRLGLPDLRRGIDAYLRGDFSYFKVDPEQVRSLGGRFIVHMLWYGYSRSLFTVDFARELLEDAEFVDVRECPLGVTASDHAQITELDNRPQESFFIEARRGAGQSKSRAGVYNRRVSSVRDTEIGETTHLTPSDRLRGHFRVEQGGSTLNFVGWALGSDALVVSVEVLSRGEVLATTAPVIERPDIAQAFPDLSGAGTCGFQLAVDPSEQGRARLELRATFEDGEHSPLGELDVVIPQRRKGIFRRFG